MRNLKKVLSLVLVFAMMATLFAGAAFTDEAKINPDYSNAVKMLTQLEVIKGRTDGSFDPQGYVTRAEFAKMIYVLKMGKDDGGLTFKNIPTNFTDVAGHWAEGYVKFCSANGLVKGIADNQFGPQSNIKLIDAVKMVLVLLGYDAKAAGLDSAATYLAAAASLGTERGLFKDLNIDPTKIATREEIAQLLYNAVFAYTVVYNSFTGAVTDETVMSANNDGYYKLTLGEKYLGLVVVKGVVEATENNYLAQNITINNTTYDGAAAKAGKGKTVIDTGANGEITLPVSSSSDLLGAYVKVYVKYDGIEDDIIVYGEPAVDETVTKVLNVNIADLKGKDADANNEKAYIQFTSGEKTYKLAATAGTDFDDTENEDGAIFGSYYYNNAGATAAYAKGEAPAGKKTVDTVNFIYDVKEGKVIAGLRLVETSFEKVNSYSDKTEKLTLSSAGTKKFGDCTFIGDVAKDDYVLVYAKDGKTVIEKVDTVTGKITALDSSNNATIGGEKYKLASDMTGVEGGDMGLIYASIKDKEAKFYVKGNYVLKADGVNSVVANDYVVVLKSGASEDEFGTEVYSVKVGLIDGTSATYKLHADSTVAGASIVDGQMYKYSISDGKIKLTVATSATSEATNSYEKAGKLTVNSNVYYVNDSSVIFLVYKNDKFAVYTGTGLKANIADGSISNASVATEEGKLAVIAGAIDIGANDKPFTDGDTTKTGYILSAKAVRNVATDKFAAEIKVLMDGEIVTYTTVDELIGSANTNGEDLTKAEETLNGKEIIKFTVNADGKMATIDTSKTVVQTIAPSSYVKVTVKALDANWLTVFESDASAAQEVIEVKSPVITTINNAKDEIAGDYLVKADAAIANQGFNAIIEINSDSQVVRIFSFEQE